MRWMTWSFGHVTVFTNLRYRRAVPAHATAALPPRGRLRTSCQPWSTPATSSSAAATTRSGWYGRIRGSNETARVRGCSPNPHMNLPSSHYDEPLVAGGSSYEYVSHSLASGGRGSWFKPSLCE